jgi:hypothetical protein
MNKLVLAVLVLMGAATQAVAAAAEAKCRFYSGGQRRLRRPWVLRRRRVARGSDAAP